VIKVSRFAQAFALFGLRTGTSRLWKGISVSEQ
jgi:hypothetical protein